MAFREASLRLCCAMSAKAVAVAFVLALVTSGAEAASSCNVTLTSAGRVTRPVLKAHHAFDAMPLFCVVQIRTTSANANAVVRIDFERLKMGANPSGALSECGESFLMIYDGVGAVGDGDHDPGKFCGESEQSQVYLAENPDVDVVLSAQRLDEQIDFDFSVSWVKREDLPERFGPRPDLFPHARGNVVAKTFCERVFQDCSRTQSCYIQSPGYPGVYPRNLHCRYYVSTKQPFIKLYVDRQQESLFDVASRDCDSLVECPFHAIGERTCDGDRLNIYDGVDEVSPLIGTFCGIGDFPSVVVGTGRELFLELISRHDGAFVGGGFDLRVGHLPGNTLSMGQASAQSCHRTFRSEDLDSTSEGLFLSPEHWYPPDTNCTFLIQGRGNESVRLYFPSFKVNSIENPIDANAAGDCRESLTIYDDSWPNGEKVIKTFCDGFSRPLEKHDFVSTGNALFVNFLSRTGSYSGSSLQFWAQFDFFSTQRDGMAAHDNACDEIFNYPEGRTFRSPRNTLVFKGPTKSESIRCKYDVMADQQQFGRIQLNVTSVALRSAQSPDCLSTCWGNPRLDHIEIIDPMNVFNVTPSCVTNCSSRSGELKLPLQYLSRGAHLSLVLALDAQTSALSYFKSATPLFTAEYRLVHPRVCGQSVVEASSGVMIFPSTPWDSPRDELLCIWDIMLLRKKEVVFTLHNFTFQAQVPSCELAALEIQLPQTKEVFFKQCASSNSPSKIPTLSVKKIPFGYVQIVFRQRSREYLGQFQLGWSQE